MAAVATLWVTISIGMGLTGLGLTDARTISYLGTYRRSEVLFSAGLLAAAILFVGFAWEVHQRLERSTGFLAVFVVGMAGQAVVAVVPIDSDGHAVHTVAGILLGLSLPLFLWRFAAAATPGAWRRRSYALLGLEVGACIVGIALSQAGLGTLAEVAPAAAFHLWVIVVTRSWPAWRARRVLGSPT